MKKMISLLCALLILMNLSGVALANVVPRASDYFGCTDVYATAMGNGKILVEFEVDATHTMLEVGAKKIYIYEQQSDGSYDNIHTFSKDTTSGMTETNSAFADGAVTYQGVSGRKYFATAALYARDSNGSETLYFDTYIITA